MKYRLRIQLAETLNHHIGIARITVGILKDQIKGNIFQVRPNT